MKTIFLAEFESRHYSFSGVGATEADAVKALERGLRGHCKQTGAALSDFYNRDDVNVFEMDLGKGYRDGSVVNA